MRIGSGLQGYYYDQGRFKRPDIETDDGAQVQVTQPVRAASASPVVESSTVLSTSLSSALWALEVHRDDGSANGAPAAPAPTPDVKEAETADKVSAFYMEYAADSDNAHAA